MITRVVLYGAALVGCWLAVLAGVMLLSDAAPAALVLFPSAALLDGLPDGVAITSRTAFSVTLTGDLSGIARQLYAQGAALVLPAGLLGCAPLTS